MGEREQNIFIFSKWVCREVGIRNPKNHQCSTTQLRRKAQIGVRPPPIRRREDTEETFGIGGAEAAAEGGNLNNEYDAVIICPREQTPPYTWKLLSAKKTGHLIIEIMLVVLAPMRMWEQGPVCRFFAELPTLLPSCGENS